MKKDKLIHIYVSNDYKEKLSKLAKRFNTTISEVIRGCVVEGAKEWVRKKREKELAVADDNLPE